jgi:hypothetical protein
VVLNLSDQTQHLGFDLAKSPQHTARCLFSTHQPENETLNLNGLTLAPFEVFVGELIS